MNMPRPPADRSLLFSSLFVALFTGCLFGWLEPGITPWYAALLLLSSAILSFVIFLFAVIEILSPPPSPPPEGDNLTSYFGGKSDTILSEEKPEVSYP